VWRTESTAEGLFDMATGLCPDNLNTSHLIFGPSWAASQSRNPQRRRALCLRFRSIVASQSDPILSGNCAGYLDAGPWRQARIVGPGNTGIRSFSTPLSSTLLTHALLPPCTVSTAPRASCNRLPCSRRGRSVATCHRSGVAMLSNREGEPEHCGRPIRLKDQIGKTNRQKP